MAEPAAATGSPGPNSVGKDSGQPDKLGFVKAATLHLLELMHDGDAVALVTFDDQVRVVKPLTVIDERSRREIGRAVQGIDTGGSTFLEAFEPGWSSSAEKSEAATAASWCFSRTARPTSAKSGRRC
jgi:hypothetical protein